MSRRMILSDKPLKGGQGLCVWECPNCGLIASTFSKDGFCDCGEKVDLAKWKDFVLYDILDEPKESP